MGKLSQKIRDLVEIRPTPWGNFLKKIRDLVEIRPTHWGVGRKKNSDPGLIFGSGKYMGQLQNFKRVLFWGSLGQK